MEVAGEHAMSQMSKQELSQLASQFAASLMGENKSNEEVIEALLDEGLSTPDAEFIVRHLLKIRAENIRREARNTMAKRAILVTFAFILGMFLNGLSSPLGSLSILFGIGFGAWQFQRYNRLMQQANSIQNSLHPKHAY